MRYWRVAIIAFRMNWPAPDVQVAMDYLESKGLRFCVDFGTQNAQQLATERYIADLERTFTDRR